MDDDEFDKMERRVVRIAGRDEDQALGRWLQHLRSKLSLPVEVTGMEDFKWEEKYVFGGWDQSEYEELRKSRPSSEDVYDLVGIEAAAGPAWAISAHDLGANVRRKSDGLEFLLALSELEAVDTDSPNAQHLEDYSHWFVNYFE